MPLLVRNLTFLTWSLDHGEVQQTSSHCQITARKQGNMTATLKTNIKQTRESIPSTWNQYRRVMVNWRHKRELYSNYSMSPHWIWNDKITNERVAQVVYNHFISNKDLKPGFAADFYYHNFTKRPERAYNFWSHASRLLPSPDYISKSWMKATATQTTICRQLVAKTKLKVFNRWNTR